MLQLGIKLESICEANSQYFKPIGRNLNVTFEELIRVKP